MANLSTTDATTLCGIIANNADWRINRMLLYARRQDCNHCASTLRETWRQPVHGLCAPVLAVLETGISDMELTPDEE